jgi:hypothetical protein
MDFGEWRSHAPDLKGLDEGKSVLDRLQHFQNHHRYRTQLWNSDEEGTELSELRFGSKRFARIAVLEKRALEGFTPAEGQRPLSVVGFHQ